MQVRQRWVGIAALAVVALLLGPTPIGRSEQAPRREDEDDTLSMQFGFYHQNDGAGDRGGNPFVDERETVYEAIIILDKSISERDHLSVRFLGDLVSSASITKVNNPQYRALQSYPSGNKHGELGIGWSRQAQSGLKFGLHGSFGYEASQYYSGGYGFDLSMPLNHDNTTLAFGFQGYTDYFQEKHYDGINNGYNPKQTFSEELSVTQILTPTTVGQAIYNHTDQFGFLATSYYSVFVNGVEMNERAPDYRRRDAITGRLKQSLSAWNALEGAYRFYNDSWDINSNTFDLRFLQYVFTKKVLLSPSYRFYTQDAAFFHGVTFDQVYVQRTSDPDLSAFNAHEMGIALTFFQTPLWNADIDLTFHYTLRSDNLDYYWTSVGYTTKF